MFLLVCLQDRLNLIYSVVCPFIITIIFIINLHLNLDKTDETL